MLTMRPPKYPTTAEEKELFMLSFLYVETYRCRYGRQVYPSKEVSLVFLDPQGKWFPSLSFESICEYLERKEIDSVSAAFDIVYTKPDDEGKHTLLSDHVNQICLAAMRGEPGLREKCLLLRDVLCMIIDPKPTAEFGAKRLAVAIQDALFNILAEFDYEENRILKSDLYQ